MKTIFESRYNKDEDFYLKLLVDSTIVLDTNVILSLYKLSEPTREYFISVLERINERLWLPFQVGNEFFANRLSVISEQVKSYNEFEKALQNIQNTLSNKRNHPFLLEETSKELTSSLNVVYEDLKSSKIKYESLISSDIILEKILDLYDGKVGNEYTEAELNEYIEIAKERYKKKIPPGYKDFKSKGGDKDEGTLFGYDRIRPYGDFILWKQTIDFAKNNSNVIIVTDDTKEDWYQEAHGRTLGPRHELITEFKKETGKNIHIYQSDVFISRIEKALGINANQEAVDEIKASNIERHNELSSDSLIKNATAIQEINANKILNSILHDNEESRKALSMSLFDILGKNPPPPSLFNKKRLNKLHNALESTLHEIDIIESILKSAEHQDMDEDSEFELRELKEKLSLLKLEENTIIKMINNLKK
ncbi:TPA: PIN-like domain-containing protein [Serratia marcescens]